MGRKRERVAPLTRWQYFTKTLYSDAASRAELNMTESSISKVRSCSALRQVTAASTGCCW